MEIAAWIITGLALIHACVLHVRTQDVLLYLTSDQEDS